MPDGWKAAVQSMAPASMPFDSGARDSFFYHGCAVPLRGILHSLAHVHTADLRQITDRAELPSIVTSFERQIDLVAQHPKASTHPYLLRSSLP
jgi:hypothetical protein